MAPITHLGTLANVPLADYFFISGIESSRVVEDRSQLVTVASPTLDATIEEDQTLDTAPNGTSPSPESESARRRSANRLSYETRKSIGSVIGPDSKATASNRSSATIKGVQVGGSGLSDADFDNALRKFAAERETFLEEIQFSAGTMVPHARPRQKPKTQRIVSEDSSSVRGGVGSIRRRLSTMNSIKRPHSMARQPSVRTSKRLSGYNSVIPAPQPFTPTPNMHPLKRRYEPVLLDRYPPKDMVEEVKRRNPFPDYVPMFAFPNDINVVSSDERPRATWHGFSMTAADSSKIHGICIITWVPLNQKASEELERQCEEWRRANMTGEERELAASLGERLASERAKLSRLLAQLPSAPSGSMERDRLEDEISAVEEKIGLMADLLRPVRHGAASKIDGLTDGDTGFWIPRAYGILGRDGSQTSFWKEWLRAIVVPMTSGGILRVPPSSPRVGMWQPLERYVVNLCAEAPSPITSITQVELSIRELRMYARKEATNELPGSRNTDLYALFRSLSLPNIVHLFEFALSESRIILMSQHTAMLHLASAALSSLLYPLKWTGVFIPILPARLIQALEAPCPYIVGIEKRYESVDLPDDDFVLVDLDQDSIESTAPPISLPRQQRRKLISLLQLAAPHHYRYGVPVGPPAYAQEAFPYDSFSSENGSIFSHKPVPPTLSSYAGLSSASFGSATPLIGLQQPVFNAFLSSRNDQSRGSERPSTGSTMKTSNSPPSPRDSPSSAAFPQTPITPISRSDSGFSLQANLREKRSGHFDASSRRSGSFAFDRAPPARRPSVPFLGHSPSISISTTNQEIKATSTYAPSVYAQSTLAASTIMPGVLMQPVRDTETTKWVEGHHLQWRQLDDRTSCSVCDEKSDEGMYRCNGCGMSSHGRCASQICLVCPVAFRADQIRAAFVRCFASLLFTYRRYMQIATAEQKKSGLIYSFNMDGFVRSMPQETAQYMAMMQQTQTFNEFIHERESTSPEDPAIKLFDQVILSKKNRGKTSFFHKSSVDFLSDSSDYLWRTATATPPSARFPGDYRQIVSRIPAKLDATFMKEPRVMQGIPRVPQLRARRKPIPSMLGLSQSSKA